MVWEVEEWGSPTSEPAGSIYIWMFWLVRAMQWNTVSKSKQTLRLHRKQKDAFHSVSKKWPSPEDYSVCRACPRQLINSHSMSPTAYTYKLRGGIQDEFPEPFLN